MAVKQKDRKICYKSSTCEVEVSTDDEIGMKFLEHEQQQHWKFRRLEAWQKFVIGVIKAFIWGSVVGLIMLWRSFLGFMGF